MEADFDSRDSQKIFYAKPVDNLITFYNYTMCRMRLQNRLCNYALW